MEVTERYELLEKIGAGSFATVYRARDRELEREVAVKQIHERFLADPKQLDRYWSESQLLASLQHPNIVTIYDVARTKGWLIMELMQGNIRDRLAGKQMDLRALRTTLAHCLRALKYLHSRGIIHGDVKPSNMMIDHRKRVKIGDFGLARRVSNVEGSLVLGTAKYMAPEMVATDLGDIGPESDLYSLGFAAYELLCGNNFEELFPGLEAYGKDRQTAWMTWHAAPDRKLPEIKRVLDGVPDDLSHVIQRLIEKNPQKRYRDAEVALSDLKLDLKIVNSEAGESSSSISLPSADTSGKRRRWIAIGAFVLSTGLSLALALWPTGGSSPTRSDQPIQGVVRKVDPMTGQIEYEDPLSGVPEEIQLPKRPKIRLVRPNQQDVFVLSKEIQPGDWLEIEATKPGASPSVDLTVSRPVTSVATVKTVDYAGQRLMLTVEQGRVRDDLTVNIPSRAKLRLNGRACVLQEIQAGDRLEVRHVIDPGGKRGHLASEVDAFRSSRSAGFVDHVDAAAHKLYVQFAAGGRVEELTLAPEVTVHLRSGDPLPLAELAKGDRLEIQADSLVRELTVFRDGASLSGSIAAIDVEKRQVHLRDDMGKDVLIGVPTETVVSLQRSPAKLEELRPQVDRAVISAGPGEEGELIATTIDVTRGVLHDRWGLVAGTSGYQERSLPPLPSAVTDAGVFQNILLTRYACDPQWVPKLLDPTAEEFRTQLQHVCKSANATSQVVVSIFGHAVLGLDKQPVFAFRDFRASDPEKTGVPLAWIVEQLDACPSQSKLLLIDIGATQPGQPSLADMLKSVYAPSPGTSVFGLSAAPEGAIPPTPEKQGLLARILSAGYQGAADADRNLRITDEELAKWVETELARSPGTLGIKYEFVKVQ